MMKINQEHIYISQGAFTGSQQQKTRDKQEKDYTHVQTHMCKHNICIF